MRLTQIMSSPAVTVRPDTGIKEAAALLVKRGFTALPVVDASGRLAGIVTEADLVKLETVPDPRSQLTPLPPGGPAPATVAEVMTREVLALPEEADAAQAARLMLERGVRCLPVTAAGRVVGVVTRRDLLRVLARSDEQVRQDVAALLAEALGDRAPAVEVTEGTVRLSGPLSPRDRRLAELLTRTVPGVVGLSVGP